MMKKQVTTHTFSGELTKREAAVLRGALIGYAKARDAGERDLADTARDLAERIVEKRVAAPTSVRFAGR